MIGSLDKERMLEYSKRYGSAIEVANAIDCHPYSVRRAAKRYGNNSQSTANVCKMVVKSLEHIRTT